MTSLLVHFCSAPLACFVDALDTGLRQNLNDGITEDDAIGMLSQHLVTKPVFDALFEDYTFAQSNPVSQAMEGTLKSLQERGLEKETEGLENFYRDIRVCVRGVTDAASKQRIIAELYQRFFKLALPDTASKLGIVYTPVEFSVFQSTQKGTVLMGGRFGFYGRQRHTVDSLLRGSSLSKGAEYLAINEGLVSSSNLNLATIQCAILLRDIQGYVSEVRTNIMTQHQ